MFLLHIYKCPLSPWSFSYLSGLYPSFIVKVLPFKGASNPALDFPSKQSILKFVNSDHSLWTTSYRPNLGHNA